MPFSRCKPEWACSHRLSWTCYNHRIHQHYPTGPCSVASTGRGGGRIARRDGTNFGGRTVSLAAPGVDILSTALGGNMTTGTGTSFAAPQVAGAVALLLAEAQARGGCGDRRAGEVDVAAALALPADGCMQERQRAAASRGHSVPEQGAAPVRTDTWSTGVVASLLPAGPTPPTDHPME